MGKYLIERLECLECTYMFKLKYLKQFRFEIKIIFL